MFESEITNYRKLPLHYVKLCSKLQIATHVDYLAEWFEESGRFLPEEVCETLVYEWYYAARNHSLSASPALCLSFFRVIACLTAQFIPSRKVLRFLLRTFRTFPTMDIYHKSNHWKAFTELVDHYYPDEIIIKKWRIIHQRCIAFSESSENNRTNFDEMSERLVFLLNHIQGERKEITVSFYLNSTPHFNHVRKKFYLFRVLTNGKSVLLPYTIKISENPAVNHWAFIWLMIEKVEMLLNGEITFTFSSPCGERIWEYLNYHGFIDFESHLSYSDNYLENGLYDDLYRVAQTERGDDEEKLLDCFIYPFIFRGIFSLFEELRFHKKLITRYPSLETVGRMVRKYEGSQFYHPRFCSKMENLIQAMCVYTLDYQVPYRVHPDHEDVWTRITCILDRIIPQEDGTIYDSIESAIDIYLLLQEHLSKDDISALENELEEVSRTIQEIQSYFFSTEPDFTEATGHRPDKPCYSGEYEDKMVADSQSYLYPEYDIWEDELQDNVARLTEKGSDGTTITHKAHWRNRLFWANTRSEDIQTRYREFGIDADEMKMYDFLVSLHRNTEPEQRIYRKRNTRPSSKTILSMVMDQSVSMSTKRQNEENDVPLHSARKVITALAAQCLKENRTFGLFGYNDIGRQSGSLTVFKDYHQSYLMGMENKMDTVTLGSFRMGLIIRHLASRIGEVANEMKHVLILLTDSGSHYFKRGQEKHLATLRDSYCPACPQERNCKYEPVSATIDFIIQGGNAFYPQYYELADVQNALQNNKEIVPFYATFDSVSDPKGLDSVFSPENWHAAMNESAIPLMLKKIRKLMV